MIIRRKDDKLCNFDYFTKNIVIYEINSMDNTPNFLLKNIKLNNHFKSILRGNFKSILRINFKSVLIFASSLSIKYLVKYIFNLQPNIYLDCLILSTITVIISFIFAVFERKTQNKPDKKYIIKILLLILMATLNWLFHSFMIIDIVIQYITEYNLLYIYFLSGLVNILSYVSPLFEKLKGYYSLLANKPQILLNKFNNMPKGPGNINLNNNVNSFPVGPGNININNNVNNFPSGPANINLNNRTHNSNINLTATNNQALGINHSANNSESININRRVSQRASLFDIHNDTISDRTRSMIRERSPVHLNRGGSNVLTNYRERSPLNTEQQSVTRAVIRNVVQTTTVSGPSSSNVNNSLNVEKPCLDMFHNAVAELDLSKIKPKIGGPIQISPITLGLNNQANTWTVKTVTGYDMPVPLSSAQFDNYVKITLEAMGSMNPEHSLESYVKTSLRATALMSPEQVLEDLDNVLKRGFYHVSLDPNSTRFAFTPKYKTNQPACWLIGEYIRNYKGPVNGYGVPHLDPESLKFLLRYMDVHYSINYWTNDLKANSTEVIKSLKDEA